MKYTLFSSKENGQSFNSEFAYFIGGNMDEVTKIQTMSVEAGIPNYVHNTFGLSSERVNLGLTPISDGFVQLFRFMFAENREQFADYMENPSKFITILRITPPPGGSGGISFPPAVFKKRVSTPEAVPTEGISHQDLENALNDIVTDADMLRIRPLLATNHGLIKKTYHLIPLVHGKVASSSTLYHT